MSGKTYQNFELLIEPFSGVKNRFSIRILSSPFGNLKGEFNLPFSDQELLDIQKRGLQNLDVAQDFGRRLFNAVFTETIQTCFRRSLDYVQSNSQGLRICLRLSDVPVLASLPWEYLYDTTNNRFLVLSTSTPLVRYLDLPLLIKTLEVPPPLHILVIIANPKDLKPGYISVEDELSRIQAAVAPLQERNLINITYLKRASLAGLQQALRDDVYHIFHYIGHGSFDDADHKGGLIFEDSNGKSQLVTNQKLGVLLSDHETLRLVVLNTCEGARSTQNDLFSGLAQYLLQQGIPAVVAMQFEINDDAAIDLAQNFYASIVNNCPIEAALAEARKSIHSAREGVEWGVPVLYLHAKSGQIFNVIDQHQVSQHERYQAIEVQLESWRNKYNVWRTEQNELFQQQLQTRVVFKAFREAQNVANKQVGLVERRELWTSLDNWLLQRPQENIFVLLGEEDSGKTCGVAAWLNQKISNDKEFPPVVFLTSEEVGTNSIEKLLLEVLQSHNNYITPDEWQTLISMWLTGESTDVPKLILVLDGINDEWHGSVWWLKLLESIVKFNGNKWEYTLRDGEVNNSPSTHYASRIATIVTCRNEYWRQHYNESARLGSSMPILVFELLPYSSETVLTPVFNVEQIESLSLQLITQVISIGRNAECDLMEVATSWLHSQAKHLHTSICETAVLHALPLPYIDQKNKIVLLLLWLNSCLAKQDIEKTLTITLLDYIDSYIALYEYIWIYAPTNRKAQEILLSSFLYWYSDPKVREALEKAVEQWLAMVHIAGFPHQRGNQAEKTQEIIDRINQRVGFQLQPGIFTFAGRTLMAVDDDKLLRLGRAALAIISQLPRTPFIHSIATGCVAEAIMDRPDKYDLFRWVLSTAPQSVWTEVSNEVEQLLTFDSPVAQQAAYRLLSYEGGKQADARQNSLPANLFPEHTLHAESRKDPCLSFFAWSKSTCESCLQRTDLEAQYLARRIESHALDPSLSVPDELHPRFAALAETIDTEQIWSTMGTGVQDLAYDQYEVALCAVSPQSLAYTIRRVVHKIPTRDTFALRQVSFHLREHALLFEEEELNSIYQAWRQLSLATQPWEEAQETAEMMLFALVLSDLSAEEQFAHLLQRPEDANIDLLQYEHYFLPVKVWSAVHDQLSRIQSEQNLLRLLWFISVHAEQIPADFLFTHIMPRIESNSAQVRRLAMKVIYNSGNRYLNFAIIGGWKREQDNLEQENSLGSLSLARYGHLLPIESLYQRIEPAYWGYAVQCRGSKASEIDYFIEKLHTLWQQISHNTVDLHLSFPKANVEINVKIGVEKDTRARLSISNENEEILRWDVVKQGDQEINHLSPIFLTEEEINAQHAQAVAAVQAVTEQEIALGNPWFAHHFEMDALEDVVVRRPDLLAEWLQAVNEQNEQWLRILQRCHSFYEALCRVLLKCSPEEGVNLYLQMAQVNILSIDTQTRWQFVDRTLFQTTPVEAITGLWTKKLEECTTDAQLLTLASMLQWGTGQQWLWTYIEQQLTSSAPICISRGATLLGYYDDGQAQMRLDQLYQDAPDTWVKQLLEISIQRWKLNDWSRHWFSKIFASDTNVEAWAAFRLFLRCVDSRFWIWSDQVRAAGSTHPHFEERWQHIEINWETIRNRIRKNEDSFEKQLFGQRVLRNQAWPWM